MSPIDPDDCPHEVARREGDVRVCVVCGREFAVSTFREGVERAREAIRRRDAELAEIEKRKDVDQ